ncbi:hypothetical protein [Halothiobacillus sp.]|uniref:hypothetical protein n=1 Tax=Halothiobacillus sp. TaxID=1891311 RepID=UPI002AD3D373|nr:hypothetical protein [Halothiobacillus sp.]
MDQALTQTEFNQQVETLFAMHGATSFAAGAGNYPLHTLFVDGDRVIPESADSPRHRYGAFCELDHALNDAARDAHVRRWLSSGEAYNLYLSMNVCRYNC